MENKIKWFEYKHLPPHLQTISEPVRELAVQIDAIISDCPQKTIGMQKLIEAKDCFVRARLDTDK